MAQSKKDEIETLVLIILAVIVALIIFFGGIAPLFHIKL